MTNTDRRRVVGLLGLGGLAGWPGSAWAQAPAPLLLARPADVSDRSLDVTRFLVSEKYDGVRALWDGHRLRFRRGGEVPAPGWFTDRLPPQALDGELWLGRGRFDALSGIVRREVPVDDEWHRVRYMVFEQPGGAGPFAERAQGLAALAAAMAWPQLVAVEQATLPDRAALRQRLHEVLQRGGEGLMLHLADAPYLTGRSDVLLKFKPLQDDEAVVVGYLPGKGRHAGRVGALRVRRADGLEFALGSGLSDAERADPPPPGTLVTYTHRGLTPGGRPRFAAYLRRADLQ